MNTNTSFAAESVGGTSGMQIPEVHMAEQTFEQFIKKERARLTKSREDALAKRAEIDASIAAIDTELAAIDAYEAAKLGKPLRGRKGGTRRSGRRQEVLAAIKKHPQGISPAALKESLGATDKSAQQSVSNALAALKRNKQVTAKDGVYKAA